MLRDLINDKINESSNDIHESHDHIDEDRLLIEIRTLEWVLLRQINQLEGIKKKFS
jgi:hypothetical protein